MQCETLEEILANQSQLEKELVEKFREMLNDAVTKNRRLKNGENQNAPEKYFRNWRLRLELDSCVLVWTKDLIKWRGQNDET